MDSYWVLDLMNMDNWAFQLKMNKKRTYLLKISSYYSFKALNYKQKINLILR